MKGDEKVISYLNQYLRIELTGHKQYLLNSRISDNWGLEQLKEKQFDYSAEETQHAARLMERILFLEGEPETEDHKKIKASNSVENQLDLDRELVTFAVNLLRDAIECCTTQRDEVSRELLEEMLADEEEHLDWLEIQLDLIGKVGVQKYLQSQM